MKIQSAREGSWVQRGTDRRIRDRLYYPERRHGFERRRPPRGTWSSRYHTWLDRYRRDRDTIAAVILVFVLLNLVDLLLTVQALSMGAIEGNPVMAYLFAVDPTLAALFKIVVGAGIALTLWSARRYRRILETSLVMVAVMTAVLFYHGYNALL